MTVRHIEKLKEDILKKKAELDELCLQLNNLPKLQLSNVYDNGLVYGIAYEDGHGTLETCEHMANMPDRLVPIAREKSKDYLDGNLYIVGFQPVKIMTVVKYD